MAGQDNLYAVAASPSAVFAIGDSNANVRVQRLPAGQSTWIETVIPNLPAGAIFEGIWASPEDDAFAVGQSGRILRYAGTWGVVDGTPGMNLHAIHGSDRGNVFAVGAGGTILRYVAP